MKIEMIDDNTCRITKEKGDPTYTASGWGTAESRLLYHVKNQLNEDGYDLIKKRAYKDGHLLDDDMLYLRTRGPKSKGPAVYIYNDKFALHDAGKEYSKKGAVDLHIDRDVFKAEGDYRQSPFKRKRKSHAKV